MKLGSMLSINRRILIKFGPRLRRIQAKIWPMLGHIHLLAEAGQNLTEFGPISANVAKVWSTSDTTQQMSGQICAEIDRQHGNSAEIGQH